MNFSVFDVGSPSVQSKAIKKGVAEPTQNKSPVLKHRPMALKKRDVQPTRPLAANRKNNDDSPPLKIRSLIRNELDDEKNARKVVTQPYINFEITVNLYPVGWLIGNELFYRRTKMNRWMKMRRGKEKTEFKRQITMLLELGTQSGRFFLCFALEVTNGYQL